MHIVAAFDLNITFGCPIRNGRQGRLLLKGIGACIRRPGDCQRSGGFLDRKLRRAVLDEDSDLLQNCLQ